MVDDGGAAAPAARDAPPSPAALAALRHALEDAAAAVHRARTHSLPLPLSHFPTLR